MKHLLTGIAATLILSSCADTGGPVYAGARQPLVAHSSLVPAHEAAAVARRSPGFVATPAPKFSGAGTVQDTRGWFPGERRRGYSNYGSSYYGAPFENYGSRRYRGW